MAPLFLLLNYFFPAMQSLGRYLAMAVKYLRQIKLSPNFDLLPFLKVHRQPLEVRPIFPVLHLIGGTSFRRVQSAQARLVR